jgi:hypothetical protein
MGFFLAVESVFSDLKEKHFKETFLKYNVIVNILGFIYGIGAVTLACALFRGEGIEKALLMMKNMLTFVPGNPRPYMIKTGFTMFLILFIGHFIGHWIYDNKKDFKIPYWLEVASYPIIILGIAYFTNDNETPFVYFQF